MVTNRLEKKRDTESIEVNGKMMWIGRLSTLSRKFTEALVATAAYRVDGEGNDMGRGVDVGEEGK